MCSLITKYGLGIHHMNKSFAASLKKHLNLNLGKPRQTVNNLKCPFSQNAISHVTAQMSTHVLHGQSNKTTRIAFKKS